MIRISDFFRPAIYAISGLWTAVVQERNMRIHLVICGYVLFFQRYYNLTSTELAVLLLTIGMVLTAELVNTAIEKAVDLSTPVYNSLAKIAKDVAAGAVLLCASISIAIGICLFGKFNILEQIVSDYFSHSINFFGLLVSIIASWWFVFSFGNNSKKMHLK